MYPSCPVCGVEVTAKAGKSHGRQQYRCKACKKTFRPSDNDMMEDTMVDDDTINPEQDKPAKVSRQRSGPRKVRSRTTAIIGDGLAAGVLLATADPDTRKNLTKEEAQSIGHPVIRMLARRVPGWLKPLLPKTNLDPDDLADLEEIAATLAKWGVRRMSIMFEDVLNGRHQQKTEAQQQQAINHRPPVSHPSVAVPTASLDALRKQTIVDAGITPATPAPENGHNPAFDVLNNVDLGVEV